MRILSLPVITGFLLMSYLSTAQNLLITSYIGVTDTIEDEGIMVAVSSDDAEQINDEIDGLYDDDLDAGWEGAPEDQNVVSVGLRFRNIGIPKGATIDSAFLIIHSHEGKSSEDVALVTIAGEASDNTQTFTEDAIFTTRPQTAAKVLWQIDDEWELWEPYQSPNIGTVIQEIVSRGGWDAGNALSIFLLGENQGLSDYENAREFESFENISDPEDGGDGQNHPERRPQLLVYFSVDGARLEVPITVTDTIEDEGIMVAVSSDDAEQLNDEIDGLYDDDLDAGWEGAPEDQNVAITGLIFRNVLIPKGSVIDSAYIQVWSHEGKSAEDVARITIKGEASDDATSYTEDALITTRPVTSANVIWEVAEEWELWQGYRTPDVSVIVNEIITREGWQTGNAIAFSLSGENQGVSDFENAREFESFENIADPEDGGDGQNHPERRPRLVVYFSSPSTSVFDFATPSVKTLKVYPNPVRGKSVQIELENDDQAILELFNQQGQLIRSAVTFGKKIDFSFGQVPAGMYIIRASQQNEIYTAKLVIEN